MRNISKKGIASVFIVVVILFIQIVSMIYLVNSSQGNGRIVNYAGIVRGATQRLVKKELHGDYCDEEISRIDDILICSPYGRQW